MCALCFHDLFVFRNVVLYALLPLYPKRLTVPYIISYHIIAVLNLKHVDGVADTEGPTVQLGAEEKYFPCCFPCYRKSLNEAGQVASATWKEGF